MLGILYLASGIIAGIFTTISLVNLALGAIIGIGLIGYGLYFAYLFMTTADTRETQYYYGSIIILLSISGLTSCASNLYEFSSYSVISRFFMTLLIIIGVYTATLLQWDYFFNKYLSEHIQVLDFDVIKQQVLYFIGASVASLIFSFAFSIEISKGSSEFWVLIFRTILVSIISAPVGIFVGYYLYKAGQESGYQPNLSESPQNELQREE